MENKTKSRIFVIFVAFIMISSTAGFALFSAPQRFTDNTNQNQEQIQLINNRQLRGEELLAVLNVGRVVIEYSYPADCEDCQLDKISLDLFAQKFSNFLVISEYASETGQKKLTITGKNGDTKELEGEITEENMLSLFCELAIAQPKECLFLDIG